MRAIHIWLNPLKTVGTSVCTAESWEHTDVSIERVSAFDDRAVREISKKKMHSALTKAIY